MGEVIGIPLELNQLVLTRGRDFEWVFEHIDPETMQPADFPAGNLYFELKTYGQHNALQQVSILRASDGTYKFTHGGIQTAAIDFYDKTSQPYSLNTDIESKLEALASIGVGNVVVHPASLVPVWQIDVTIAQATSEVQHIAITGSPTVGGFIIGFGTRFTGIIGPNPTAGQIQTALEEMSNVAPGDVVVTGSAGSFDVAFGGNLANRDVPQMSPLLQLFGGGSHPKVTITTTTQGTTGLLDSSVELISSTIADHFDTIEALVGVDIVATVHDQFHMTLLVTAQKAFTEVGLIISNYDVTSAQLLTALNDVDELANVVELLQVGKYWNHFYEVEFVGDLADTPQPALDVDYSGLNGLYDDASAVVEVLKPGKAVMTPWLFTIDGSEATIKIESEAADVVLDRTSWQLVFLPEGEDEGGSPVARGLVKEQL